ncbi:NAD(+) diphosphatase [Streptomyces sp. ISL-66]|uniref:NAD(+) diphosphatase n=1 Tax=Streptomyces sp. ISL-66 TaxID=2819186 RepID=UPI001BE70AE4|nr:NAD(+) diphosphatase [Streptomyces sp. ISL-66]MBT2472442.1 NAD(+) diphosphatase [Streptomyces sp. ISL-66]
MEPIASAAAAPAYARIALDRAGGRREDPTWVAARLAAPDAEFVPLWNGRCLLDARTGAPLRLRGAAAAATVAAAGQLVLLGTEGQPRDGERGDGERKDGDGSGGEEAEPRGVFAADLSDLGEQEALGLAGAAATADVRDLFARLTAPEAALLACARGLLHWHRRQRYCGVCGSATGSAHGGHVRVCGSADCGVQHFPRIEPAVIVLVQAPGDPARCLLARHRGAPENSFSLLAGFAEIGESLEGAVEREIFEEAGVPVVPLSYEGSQGWPFPSGLMVGFRARATSEVIRVDRRELLDARWFTKDELRDRLAAGHSLGPADSLGHRMLHDWLYG